ncbi:MAG: iron-containing alcohol dehydrogenase [Candidatus Brocadiia bacterium]
MEDPTTTARKLIEQFKGDCYAFGPGLIGQVGQMAARLGDEFFLVRGRSCEGNGMLAGLRRSFAEAGVVIVGQCMGAGPNSPVRDVERVRDQILDAEPQAVVGLGGGSLIDGLKGSIALASLGGRCTDYYGVGKVGRAMKNQDAELVPFLVVQTASGSGAHLTKYANITDTNTMQKKLFIDRAVVPPLALFDYDATVTMPPKFTKVGAFDGICHLLEVYFGLPEGHGKAELVESIALTGLELIMSALPGALEQPRSSPLRERIGLGTDLGGYAIMIGSTNGPHLNSFSLVDVMDHGEATALLTPYYVAFFTPAIEGRVRKVGRLYAQYGYADEAALAEASGPELGLVVGRAMAALAESVGFPVRLEQVEGFREEHIKRMLEAARDPALSSKLEGMPIAMEPDDVDRFMAPILEAARTGDFSQIVPHPDYC